MKASSINSSLNNANKRIWRQAEIWRREGETLRQAYFRIKLNPNV